MSEEIELNSRAETMRFIHRVNGWSMQYPRFVESTGIKLVKQIILPIIKKRMADFGYSRKIINTTVVGSVRLDTDGFMEISIESDYMTATGYNVGTGREKGTRRHFIAPKFKKALSWIQNGFRRFSKGHWVKGITASNIIEKTIEQYQPSIQQMLDELTDESIMEKVKK
jgi:hypothetical protein